MVGCDVKLVIFFIDSQISITICFKCNVEERTPGATVFTLPNEKDISIRPVLE